MTNPDEYRIHSGHNQHVEGPDFIAMAVRPRDARLFLERIQALAREVQQTKHSYSIYLDNQRREILTTCKERDEALDRVAELEAAAPAAPEDDTEDGGPYSVICEQIVGNQIRVDEGVLNLNPASFSAVGSGPKEAEKFCDRLNLERDRRIKAEGERDALRARLAELEGGKRDGPTKKRAEAQIAAMKILLSTIKVCCSSARSTAYDLQETLKEGGAK